MNERPNFVLFAGINGAGKSTLYITYKEDFPVLSSTTFRVNPDELLREFGGHPDNKKDQARSAKLALKKIKEYTAERASFNQETTLGGNVNTHIKRLKTLKDLGYHLTLYYVALDSVELALERIAERVAKGGHDIPEELVMKRYTQTFENLKYILPFFDNIDIFDNSSKEFSRVYKKIGQDIVLDSLDDYPYLKFIGETLK